MSRIVRTGAIATLAVALFLAGGLGVLRRPVADPVELAIPAAPEAGSVLTATSAGSLDATIESLQARLRERPDDARAAATLGLAYVQQARITGDPSWYPKAETLLVEAAATLGGADASGEVGLAALAAARHDFASSFEHAREARRIAPSDGQTHGVVGDALVELGRYDEAFRAYQRFADIEPGMAAFARVAYARELRGDVEGAAEAMRVAADLAGTPDDAAWAWFQLGELAWHRGDAPAAARSYRTAEGFAPSWVPPTVGLARVAWARGDLEAAIAGYRDAVTRLPLPEYVIALGDLLTLSGDRAGASQQYELARVQASLLRSQGVNVDLELAMFEADHGSARAALAAARAEWERRRSIHVADAYAWALHAAGRYDAAARVIGEALRLGTRDAGFLYHAGMIALARGDLATARASLREALAINPHFSILLAADARYTLTRIGAEP